MIIKVCGMRDPDNIRAVEEAGADWMGFICWQGTRRNVAEVPSYLPACKRVGVFVNPSQDFVNHWVQALGLDFIQLHGQESIEFCDQMPRPVIKAISISSAEDLDKAQAYEGHIHYFLFDTKCKCVGGSGEQFDWSILSHYNGQTPFLLSGGIGPRDEQRILQFHHPKCIGIDLNSRFEISPALKDNQLIRNFIQTIRNNESY